MKLWMPVLVLALITGCGGDDEPDFVGGPDDNYGGIVEGPDGPIAGASVMTLGASSLSTTTNAAGLFALQLPAGETTILIEASAHWGSQLRVRIGPGQRIVDAEIELATDAEVATVQTELGITIDPAKGVVATPFFSDNLDVTGAGASITAASDAPFTFDMDDELVSSPVLLPNGTEQELVFTNVAIGPTSATATGTNTVICSPEFDTVAAPFQIRAKVVTEIRIFCAAGSSTLAPR